MKTRQSIIQSPPRKLPAITKAAGTITAIFLLLAFAKTVDVIDEETDAITAGFLGFASLTAFLPRLLRFGCRNGLLLDLVAESDAAAWIVTRSATKAWRVTSSCAAVTMAILGFDNGLHACGTCFILTALVEMIPLADGRTSDRRNNATAAPWVFAINDCDWYIGCDLREAVKAALQDYTGGISEVGDARALTAEEMEKLRFRFEGCEGGMVRTRSFKRELNRRIASGEIAPSLFASTEF